MKKPRLWVGALVAAALTLPAMMAATATAATPPGIHVAGGRLVEADGTPLVLRGVNHAHTWYASQTQSFADIASLGANSVRTVLSSGDRWTRNSASDVAHVISLAKQNELISVLEVHDTTGYGEDGAAATLSEAVDYWISIKDVLIGQEDYVLLNIGNEPYGNNASANASYVQDNKNAIARLRAAGLGHTIVVDAPNWGQDWSGTMRDNAAGIFTSDPDRNVLFSVHMYGVYDTAAEIRAYMQAFQSAGLPLIVGEFGFDHSDGNPDEDTILSEARARGIGWLGWSWSGNGGGVEYLDLVTGFDKNRLSSWGQRLFNGADGIAATSRTATIFSGVEPDPDPTTDPDPDPTTDPDPDPTTDPDPDPVGACSATLTVGNSWPGGYQAAVTVTAGSSALSGWTTAFSLPSGSQVNSLWSGRATYAGGTATVVNESWNGQVAAGQSTTYGFVASGTAPTGANVTCAAR